LDRFAATLLAMTEAAILWLTNGYRLRHYLFPHPVLFPLLNQT
jgi:hypothetical protein